MNCFQYKKSVFSQRKNRLFLLLFTCIFLLFFTACGKKVEPYDYVSELRDNILLAETDGFAFRAYAVTRENPYVSDGVAMEASSRCEIYLVAPSGDKECTLSFTVNGKQYGGEMSYDNVKAEYYFFCTLNISALRELPCSVVYGETELTFSAQSVVQQDTLTPKAALEALNAAENELFASMTDRYGFAGEIYIRLLYEDAPFYYIGVIDKNGKTTAFLLNAQTGKVLAKRQS